MSAQIIDGKAIAQNLRNEIKAKVASMVQKPGLAVVLVGDDPASKVYVGSKIKACAEVGINSIEHKLPADIDTTTLYALIDQLNADPAVNGILVQLPLPKHLNENNLIARIDPRKDVDGLTVENAGRLFAGLPGLLPCTPQGSMRLIRTVMPDLSGKLAVVIGRSLLFGKPMGQLLLQADATVIQCHSRTRDLAALCRQADILVAAVGRAKMVQADWVKPGAVVVDVGINRTDAGLVGDVDFEAVKEVAGAITPVPGGVGPMTIACLLNNTLIAAQA